MSDVLTDAASVDATETAGSPDPSASTSTPDSSQPPGDSARADDADRGDGRTARGRFAKTKVDGGDDPDDGAARADAPAGPEDDAAKADAPGEPAPDAAPEPQAPAESPFVVTAVGRQYQIPGATLDASGRLTVAADGVQRFHEFVGKAIKYDAERAEIKQARATLDQARAVNDARYGEIGKRFAALMQMRQQGDVDGFTQWAQAFWDDLPTLQRQAQLDARAAELDLRAKQFEPDPEQYQQQQEQLAEQTVVQVIHEHRQQPWAAALNDADWKALYQSVEQHPDAYFVATEEGLFFREALFESTAKQLAAARQASAEAAKKAEAAAKFNAARQPTPSKAPPVVTPPGTAAAATPKKISNWAEWNKAVG